MEKLVTVGIPFFNSQLTLENSVKSVLIQTYSNIEIILINDGSSDSSFEIASSIAKQDSRIKLISDGLNLGLIRRLNQLIEMSKGEYFARMDSDDLMFPNRIEEQVRYLENNHSVDVICTGFVSINKNLEPQGVRNCLSEKISKYEFFKNGSNILHPSVMSRTAWFKKNKYDEDFERAEDRELFCRTISRSSIINLTIPLMFYMDVQNFTLIKYLKSYKTERKVLNRHWKGNLSLSQYLFLVGRSYLKSFMIRLVFFLNAQDRLVISKHTSLSSSSKCYYSEIINNIISRQS